MWAEVFVKGIAMRGWVTECRHLAGLSATVGFDRLAVAPAGFSRAQ